MKAEIKNSCLALAVLLAIVSLPLSWCSVDLGQATDRLSLQFSLAISPTGLNNGSIGGIPIWLTISTILLASIIQIVDLNFPIRIAKSVQWPLTIVATALVSITLMTIVLSRNLSPGIGCLTGSLAGVLSLTVAMFPKTPVFSF
jgi:hypothetical protein